MYNNDVVIIRTSREIVPDDRPTRSEICEFSSRARKRLAFIASNTPIEFETMVTLTYPKSYPTNGLAVKGDFSVWRKRYQRRFSDSYLWFLEFQARGAPHIHYLTTTPAREIDKLWLSSSWYEVVASGDQKHLLAGTRVEELRQKGAWYALKYAGKMRQKKVPENYRNVGRFYGHSRDVAPQPIIDATGNLDEIFEGHEGYKELLESGYRVIFRSSGTVASNLIKGE